MDVEVLTNFWSICDQVAWYVFLCAIEHTAQFNACFFTHIQVATEPFCSSNKYNPYLRICII